MKTIIRHYFVDEGDWERFQIKKLDRYRNYVERAEGVKLFDYGHNNPETMIEVTRQLDYQPKRGELVITDFEGIMEVKEAYTDVMNNTYEILVTEY